MASRRPGGGGGAIASCSPVCSCQSPSQRSYLFCVSAAPRWTDSCGLIGRRLLSRVEEEGLLRRRGLIASRAPDTPPKRSPERRALCSCPSCSIFQVDLPVSDLPKFLHSQLGKKCCLEVWTVGVRQTGLHILVILYVESATNMINRKAMFFIFLYAITDRQAGSKQHT